MEDVNALTEYQKLKKVESIEAKIKRLSFVPTVVCGVLILWAFGATWQGVSWSPMHFVVLAGAIACVGHSNIKRTDLLKQLFYLKYGK